MPQITQSALPTRLDKLLRIVAASPSQELSLGKLAQQVGINEATLTKYLQILSDMHLVSYLPAWASEPRGREIKRPKISLSDSGLSAALAGVDAEQALKASGRKYFGMLLESFVHEELAKQSLWSQQEYRLHHYRDRDGREVDLIAELGDGTIIAIEVKASTIPDSRNTKGLRLLKDRLGQIMRAAVLLHLGELSIKTEPGIWMLPIASLWHTAQ